MSQMYVSSKKPEPVTATTEKGERLTNNGMNRDRTDKNPVADEYDFAALRANLGKKKPAPKADDAKLAAARARTGHEPGEAKVSNQMFVAGKKPVQAATAAEAHRERLTTNGMNRDRTDKNAVADEHDFAALRANLRKTS